VRYVGGVLHGQPSPEIVHGARILVPIALGHHLFGADVYRLRASYWGFDGRMMPRRSIPRRLRPAILKSAGGYWSP